YFLLYVTSFSCEQRILYTYTLSLHDALPISSLKNVSLPMEFPRKVSEGVRRLRGLPLPPCSPRSGCVEISGIRIEPFRKKLHQRSEEHTSELQSQENLVFRLLR